MVAGGAEEFAGAGGSRLVGFTDFVFFIIFRTNLNRKKMSSIF